MKQPVAEVGWRRPGELELFATHRRRYGREQAREGFGSIFADDQPFHSITPKHLPNYLNEFECRWNTRKLDDGERVSRAIKAIDGKRLEYRGSVDNPPYLLVPKGQQNAPFEG